MNQHKSFTQTSNKLALLRDFILVIFSVLAVLIATLYPFDFYFPDSFSREYIFDSFENSSTFNDQINNVLLFIPLGFSFTILLERTRMKLIYKVLGVILISAGLSLLVEFLQMFLPSRAPTVTDIFNNTVSGFVGLICFYMFNSQSFTSALKRIENSRTSNSVHKLTLLFIGYILLPFLIAVYWQGTTNLSNWNLNFPLVIGNEKTGDRPWQGYVSELYIADREISKNEVAQVFSQPNYLHTLGNSLLASYKFTGKSRSQDLTGQLPELLPLPQGQAPEVEDIKGVALSSNYWLKTAVPATSLNKRIRETSEFTISTTVATTSPNQTGPARIISLSNSSLRRNLTLGQQGTSLDLRVRTPITGENAADLKLSVPGIFADTNPHHIVITYSRATIQVYVDNLQNSYSLNLLELIPQAQKMFYYGLTFIFLGLCLMVLTTMAKRRLTFYRILLISGILLPSVIMESILVSDSGKSISLKDMLIGIFLTAGTILILRVRTWASVKKAAS